MGMLQDSSHFRRCYLFSLEGCPSTGGELTYQSILADTCQQPIRDQLYVWGSARAVPQLALPSRAVCQLMLFRDRNCDPSSNYGVDVGGCESNVCLPPLGLDSIPTRSSTWPCEFVCFLRMAWRIVIVESEYFCTDSCLSDTSRRYNHHHKATFLPSYNSLKCPVRPHQCCPNSYQSKSTTCPLCSLAATI
jgi:hypothetical protein